MEIPEEKLCCNIKRNNHRCGCKIYSKYSITKIKFINNNEKKKKYEWTKQLLIIKLVKRDRWQKLGHVFAFWNALRNELNLYQVESFRIQQDNNKNEKYHSYGSIPSNNLSGIENRYFLYFDNFLNENFLLFFSPFESLNFFFFSFVSIFSSFFFIRIGVFDWKKLFERIETKSFFFVFPFVQL